MSKSDLRGALGSLRRDLRTETGRQVGGTLAASFGIQGVNVLTGVLLARSLGVEDRGTLAILLLWPFLLSSVATFGVPDAVAYANARALAPSRVVFGTALAIGAAESVIVAATSIVVLSLVAPDVTGPTVAVVVAVVPLYIGAGFATAALQANRRLRAFNVTRLSVPFAMALLLLAFAATATLTVTTAVVAYFITYVVAATVGVSLALRGTGRLAVDRRIARTLVGYGARSHVSFVATTLNERLDQLLISIFLSATSLGLYVVAATLTAGTAVIGASVALVALPRIARVADDRDRALRMCRRLALGTLALSVVATIPVAALAPWLLATLFGDGFAAGSSACRILLAAAVFLAFSRVLGSMLKALGKPLRAGEGDAAGLAVTIVALAVLLPLAGIVGAAIASLLAYAVACVAMAHRLSGALGCPMRELFFASRSKLISVLERPA
jgi:O-antigen/teichoic acid export membrane protein